MGALSTYINLTRRLLHDSTAQFWSNQELTDDINQARVRLAGDTKCLRQVVTGITLSAGVETYDIPTAVSSGTPANLGPYVVEVYSVTINWGGTYRYVCQNRAFSEQNAKLRQWTTYQERPGSIARVGGSTLYINPIPDQAYTSDWDLVTVPVPLVLDTDVEPIPIVFQPCIPYFAAHIAKYNEQTYDESELYYKKYLTERQAAMWAFSSYRVRDFYRR